MSRTRPQSSLPEIGTWWRHPLWRDAWRVEKVGRKYVWLLGQTPGVPKAQIHVDVWPGKWEPA